MFKDEFKKLRLDHQFTQDDLAKELGVSKSTISMYESGDRIPGLEMLELIADFFNVDMNHLTDSKVDTSSEMIILNRAAKKMSAEQRKKLLEMAKVLFREEFHEDE